MATNIFASMNTAIINEIENLAGSALPLLASAILLLVIALVGFWFIARLFGFDFGLSETMKQRIRDKAAKRKAAFPFAVSKRSKKVAAEGGPWSKPNSWEESFAFDTEDLEKSTNFFQGFIDPTLDFKQKVELSIQKRYYPKQKTLTDAEKKAGFDRLVNERADAIYDAWDRHFSRYGSIRGLANAKNLGAETKAFLLYHAARLAKRRTDAINEELNDWAKSYGDGMAPHETSFVA